MMFAFYFLYEIDCAWLNVKWNVTKIPTKNNVTTVNISPPLSYKILILHACKSRTLSEKVTVISK